MQLGMVGLGRMGANMTRRLMRGGHSLVVSDLSADAVKQLASEGATASSSLEDLVSKLKPPRAVWIMVPAGGPTETTVQKLAQYMQAGDTIIDGGNSYFKDDVRRAKELQEQRNSLYRRGDQRRRVGPGARLLHDDWRPERSGAAARSYFQDTGTRHGRYSAHSWTGKARRHSGRWIHSLWPIGRRAFREDGAQRH